MPDLFAFVSRIGSPQRLYIQTTTGVQQPASRRGRRLWIVARSLCRFFKVPLMPDGTATQQAGALDLQIKRLSPFAETGSHYHFGPEFIGVWLWDQQATRSAAEAVGVDIRRMRVLPESALQESSSGGVRLVATVDGIEGQNWSNGHLAASRWWPSPPNERAWMLFQRGAALAPEEIVPLPHPVRLAWRDRPWTQSRMPGSFDLGSLDLRLVAASITALFLIAYGYLGAERLRLSDDLGRVQTAIAAQSSAAAPIVRARAAALENLAAIHDLEDLDRFPGQVALMARVSRILPKNETHLVAWTYEGGRLEVTVAAHHPLDALYFVRSLQKIGGFSNVTAERAGGENSLRLHMGVDPR